MAIRRRYLPPAELGTPTAPSSLGLLLAQAARERLEGPLIVVLVPLYFAFTGLRTRLDLIRDPQAWSLAAVVVGGGDRQARGLLRAPAVSRGATRRRSGS